MYILGYEVSSQQVCAALIDAETRQVVAQAVSDSHCIPVFDKDLHHAEQDPQQWWQDMQTATQQLLSTHGEGEAIVAIGIAYETGGMVCVDGEGKPLAPALLAGDERQNAPATYANAFRVMTIGDYVALQLTQQMLTTEQGLRESGLWYWDGIDEERMNCLGIPPTAICDLTSELGWQGELTADAAAQLGLPFGIPVTARIGITRNRPFGLGAQEAALAAGYGAGRWNE